jgi:uncharacterized membrane protein
MKKSNIATLIVFLLLIPLTLFLGTKLSGRGYYITGTLIIVELMIPFFMAFEGRKPQARELVLVAVMCALAIAGRVVIPMPHFKAVFPIILLSGIAFGPETGFMVGAISAFASNFFYGQGPFTPWQMFAYGLAGMLAGFAFAKGRLPRKAWLMAVFGFVAVVLVVGPVLDSMALFLGYAQWNWQAFAVVFAPGIAVNCLQGLCTMAVMLIFGKPLLSILDRISKKYGILGA